MNSYTFNCKINLDDLDYMGIVGNAQWLIILERARINLLEQINFPFEEMLKQKLGGVVAEANIKFLKPAFFNDKLEIKIVPAKPFSKGLTLNYEVKNHKNIYLTAELIMVFVDGRGKSILMPEEIRDKFFNKVE